VNLIYCDTGANADQATSQCNPTYILIMGINAGRATARGAVQAGITT
jgi:hypothetical protein